MLQPAIRAALVAAALQVGAGGAKAQVVPSWQDETLKSIARIETQRCVGECQDPEKDRWVRHGTGFAVQLQGFDQPVLLTALHLVAGANSISYQFTEGGENRTTALVLAIDKGNDLAVLQLTGAHRPLTIQGQLPSDNQVIVYGYKLGDHHPESDQGLVKLKAPQTLGNAPLGQDAKEEINRLGYPSLGMSIVGLEQVLDPGDSGAPVFNSAGQVVGMAQGGIPGSQLSWMVPSATLNSPHFGKDVAAELGIYGFHQFFAAFNTFFEERTRTKFGAQPKALFNLEWRTSLPLLKPWGRLMDEAYDNNTALPGTIYNAPHQTVRIEPSNSLFPGANDPFRAAIANAALSVVCYRAEVFEQLLQTPTEELPQADLDLRLPLGTFANTANDDGLSLSYRWQGPASDAVVLFSNTPLIYRPGIGRYHRHPAIEFIEDLYGGACRVKLEATDPAQESGVAQLDRALRFNGACLHLFLTADTHTPVSFTAYLPLGRDLSAGELWGILPDLEPGGTVDDLACQ